MLEKENKIQQIKTAEEKKTEELEKKIKEREIDDRVTKVLNIQLNNFKSIFKESGQPYLDHERAVSEAEKEQDNGEALERPFNML